ncbi:hypothetical protein FQN57_005872 [Myotisia sp. PD_48]|nr:hypothetical protein FQN57_005872 [Myotisia sp. PD_48]
MVEHDLEEESKPFIGSRAKPDVAFRSMFCSLKFVIGQWIVILALVLSHVVFGLSRYRCDRRYCFPTDHVYSPAQDVISYKSYNFQGGFDEQRTKYQGPPSPEVDSAWKDLYRYGISKIPKEQARLLSNKTVPIPREPGQYIIGLDVFHQIHCLNMIRKRIWRTGKSLAEEEDQFEVEHIDHCIDAHLQYFMCTADISPIVWNWDFEVKRARPIATIYHTCRDFEAISQWAKDHQLESFDEQTFVEDDL